MELNKNEVDAVERIAGTDALASFELSNLELALVGGGCGEIILG